LPNWLNPLLVLAALGTSVPALAQNKVGTLDDLREAHALCYDATMTNSVDRTLVTANGWSLVTIVAKDGTRSKSDAIYSHPSNPGWIVVMPDNDLCFARVQFADGDPIQDYLDELTQYRPEKQPEGVYMFCAEGRVGRLEQVSRTKGPMVSAFYSTQVESGRCQSS